MSTPGPAEILVILVVALIVLGPQRLPDVARQIGRALGEVRRLSMGFQRELHDAMDDRPAPVPATPRPPLEALPPPPGGAEPAGEARPGAPGTS
jgi:sec-independent protein translocase protein TatA